MNAPHLTPLGTLLLLLTFDVLAAAAIAEATAYFAPRPGVRALSVLAVANLLAGLLIAWSVL